MPISPYLENLRRKVGHDLLILPSVTIVNRDHEGRILLARHGDTRVWVAPGGAIEPNEAPADAAVREMWEETGLFVELLGIIGVYGGPEFQISYSSGDEVTYVMTVFESKPIEGNLHPLDGEVSELRYFGADDLKDIPLAKWAQVVLPRSFDSDSTADFERPTWTPGE